MRILGQIHRVAVVVGPIARRHEIDDRDRPSEGLAAAGRAVVGRHRHVVRRAAGIAARQRAGGSRVDVVGLTQWTTLVDSTFYGFSRFSNCSVAFASRVISNSGGPLPS